MQLRRWGGWTLALAGLLLLPPGVAGEPITRMAGTVGTFVLNVSNGHVTLDFAGENYVGTMNGQNVNSPVPAYFPFMSFNGKTSSGSIDGSANNFQMFDFLGQDPLQNVVAQTFRLSPIPSEQEFLSAQALNEPVRFLTITGLVSTSDNADGDPDLSQIANSILTINLQTLNGEDLAQIILHGGSVLMNGTWTIGPQGPGINEVPEPASLAIWGMIGGAGVWWHRRQRLAKRS
jgi:hypothetical protein